MLLRQTITGIREAFRRETMVDPATEELWHALQISQHFKVFMLTLFHKFSVPLYFIFTYVTEKVKKDHVNKVLPKSLAHYYSTENYEGLYYQI